MNNLNCSKICVLLEQIRKAAFRWQTTNPQVPADIPINWAPPTVSHCLYCLFTACLRNISYLLDLSLTLPSAVRNGQPNKMLTGKQRSAQWRTHSQVQPSLVRLTNRMHLVASAVLAFLRFTNLVKIILGLCVEFDLEFVNTWHYFSLLPTSLQSTSHDIAQPNESDLNGQLAAKSVGQLLRGRFYNQKIFNFLIWKVYR